MPNTKLSTPVAATAQNNPGIEPRLISAVSADGAAPQFNIPFSSQAIQSVESVDLDLVLTTATGEKIILQQGALKAATSPDSKIVFSNGDSITAADQIKKLGILKPVEGGSFRLKSGDASPAVAEKVTGDAFGLGKELQDTMSQLTETSKQLEKVLQTLTTASLSTTTDDAKPITAGPGTGTGVQKITPQSDKFASPSPGSPPKPEVEEFTSNNTDSGIGSVVKVNNTLRSYTGNSQESFSGIKVTGVGGTKFEKPRSLNQVDFTQIDVNKRIDLQLNGQNSINLEQAGKAIATLTLPGVLNAKTLVLTTSATLPEGFTINGQSFVKGAMTINDVGSLVDTQLSVSWKVGAPSVGGFLVAVKFYDGTNLLDYGNAPLTFFHADTLPTDMLDGNSNLKIFLSNAGYSYNVTGNSGDDNIVCGSGNDTLDGGSGNDNLVGGSGSDTYIVDSLFDVLTENALSGTDTVISSVNYTLIDNFENLTLAGAATSGTGNGLNNNLAATNKASTLMGLAGQDTLIGGAGNDTLDGGTGIDSMTGGGGDDTYTVDVDIDKVVEVANGGTDTVLISSAATMTTYTLATEVENLTLAGAVTTGIGNASNNTITGLAGIASSLSGLVGDDTLIGGTGNDTLDGGTGTDSMTGGGGNDTYTVDVADDVVTEAANGGTDTVLISATSVMTAYTLGSDVENLTLAGAAAVGNGNASNNVITGRSGAISALNGLDGNDTLIGGSLNDKLDGGSGTDSMTGGGGNDIYTVDVTADKVEEIAGGGIDTVLISAASTMTTYTLATQVENLTLAGAVTTGIGNVSNNIITGLTGVASSLSGLAGNDSLIGGIGNDTLDGGIGTDSMTGGEGDDTYTVDLVGDSVVEASGGGADSVLISSTATMTTYTLANEVEKLTLAGAVTTGIGNAANNTITGLADIASSLSGLTGNDTLIGGTGNDTLIGGADGDSLVGGGGIDTASYTTAAAAVTVSLVTGTGTSGDAAGDVLVAITNLIGSSFADTLTGDGADNTIAGGAGADTIDGGLGNDAVDYTSSAKAISVNLSLVTAQSGGDAEGDMLTSIERVIGSGQADSLHGSTGDETLIGGAGNDTLYGSAGADTLNGGAAAGAAAGTDTVDYSASSGALTVNLTLATAQSGGDAQGDILSNIFNIVGSSSADKLTGNSSANTLSGGDGDDVIVGGGGADFLVGGDGNDELTGGLASDTLSGGAGDDTLTGGGANDRLIGGNGNDLLIGGTGNDTMIGGTGNDTYVVDSTSDVVTENSGSLVNGSDRVQIKDISNFSLSALQATNIEILDLKPDVSANNVAITSAAIQSIVGKGDGSVLSLRLGAGDTYEITTESGIKFETIQATGNVSFYVASDTAHTSIAQISFIS